MFDWYLIKDYFVILGMYVELDFLIFVCSGILKGSILSGGILGGGDWFLELVNFKIGVVSFEFGSLEDKW